MLESNLSIEAESGQACELADAHRAILELLCNHLGKSGRYLATPLAPTHNDRHGTGTPPTGSQQRAVNRKTGGRGSRYNPLGQVEGPALIPEDGEEGPCYKGEWLVDDMAPPVGKRRRNCSTQGVVERLGRRERRRGLYQPRLSMTDSTVEVGMAASPSPSPSSSSPAPPRHTPVKNTPPKGTPPKGTPTKDGASLGTRSTPPTIATQVPAAPTDSALLRLRVSIESRLYLIPCPRKMPDGRDTTVGWLASEAAERYRAHLGARPTLTLTTVDGAHLSPGDALYDVLQSNEEVRGVVEHKELPPLSERYQLACRSDGAGESVVIS